MKVLSASNYTIYIPDHPKRMVIYLNAHISFPAGNGKKSKTKYNFREEVAGAIYDEETVAVVALYGKNLIKVVRDIICEYAIVNVCTSGWSVGGNDALVMASELVDLVPFLKVLLIDSNHTNNVSDRVFKKFDVLEHIPISDVSNNLNKVKVKKLQKVLETGRFAYYLKVKVPDGFKGSHHRYCRDSTLDNHLYDFIFGRGELDKNWYTIEDISGLR